jgi:hypothetical protein
MDKYYYVDGGNNASGPIFPTEFAAHGLKADTLVCKVGDNAWTRLADIPGLASYLGAPMPPRPAAPGNMQELPPDNNMAWAILSTVLCCLPIGIYAIIQASKVHDLWHQGYRDAARQCADSARRWSIIGAVVSVAVSAIYFVVLMLTSVL